jgi:hypothetical protein
MPALVICNVAADAAVPVASTPQTEANRIAANCFDNALFANNAAEPLPTTVDVFIMMPLVENGKSARTRRERNRL